MSQANRIISTGVLTTMSPREIRGALKTREFQVAETPFIENAGDKGYGQHVNFTLYVKKTVDWKGDPLRMPMGAREGLGKAITLSKAAMDVTGTAVDPKTGRLVPRKVLTQREKRETVTPLSPEEVRARKRAYRRPGVTPYTAIPGVTVGGKGKKS